MANPCFLDNCSVHWGTGEGPSGMAHEAVVQLDAVNGSTSCGDGTASAPNAFTGIGVLVSPDAGNALTRHTNGLYVSGTPTAVKAVRSGTGNPGTDFNARTPLPAATVSGAPKFGDAGGWSWTNATGHDVIIQMRGQLRIRYAVMSEASAGPTDVDYRPSKRTGDIITSAAGVGGAHGVTPYNFNMSVAMRRSNTTIAGGDIKNVIVQKFDGSGVIFENAGPEDKEDWRDFTWTEGVSAGSVLTISTLAWFEGPLQTMNVLFGTADDNTDYGFSMNEVKLYAIPVSVAETPA